MIILKRIVKKQDVRFYIGFIWLWLRPSGGLFVNTSVSIKGRIYLKQLSDY
jgi:hypothetical protein